MKKIFIVLFALLIVCSSSYVAFAETTASKTLTLEARFVGFGFKDTAYSVASLRFYYTTNPVPNSDKSSPLELSRARFKFQGEFYTLSFVLKTEDVIEADIVVPTNELLNVPIGHLSLRLLPRISSSKSLIVGNLKIYPEEDGDKEGQGEFDIYLNREPGPMPWKDLSEDKDQQDWYN